jgi:8-oxo-dGTP pyrophosphatase MutT (NUDIX family)
VRSASPLPKTLSAGIVVVRHEDARYRLLCLRAFHSWDFPKAAVLGESDPLATAVAELQDATGIHDLDFHWGEDYRETVPYADGRVSRYYLAQTRSAEVALRQPSGADSAEDHEYRWVTFGEAEDILPPRLALVLDWVIGRLAGGHTR